MNVVRRITQLREQRGWSNYRLAKQAGITQSTLSNLMHRGNSPTIETIRKLCVAFDITLVEFFSEDGAVPGITKEQAEHLQLWDSLTREQKLVIEGYIQSVIVNNVSA